MRRLPHVLLVLGIAVFMAADDAKKKKPSDYDEIQGVWVVGETWSDGERVKKETGDDDDAIRFGNRKAEWGTLVRGKFVLTKILGPWTGSLKLDESKSPKHMTMTFEEVSFLFVYSLKGDTLRICVVEDSSELQRPKTLPEKGKKGEGLGIFTLTRVRPKKP